MFIKCHYSCFNVYIRINLVQIIMNWEQLLSLKRQGDTSKLHELSKMTRQFEVDYDRIIRLPLEVYKIKRR
jgi:dGTPase